MEHVDVNDGESPKSSLVIKADFIPAKEKRVRVLMDLLLFYKILFAVFGTTNFTKTFVLFDCGRHTGNFWPVSICSYLLRICLTEKLSLPTERNEEIMHISSESNFIINVVGLRLTSNGSLSGKISSICSKSQGLKYLGIALNWDCELSQDVLQLVWAFSDDMYLSASLSHRRQHAVDVSPPRFTGWSWNIARATFPLWRNLRPFQCLLTLTSRISTQDSLQSPNSNGIWFEIDSLLNQLILVE